MMPLNGYGREKTVASGRWRLKNPPSIFELVSVLPDQLQLSARAFSSENGELLCFVGGGIWSSLSSRRNLHIIYVFNMILLTMNIRLFTVRINFRLLPFQLPTWACHGQICILLRVPCFEKRLNPP